MNVRHRLGLPQQPLALAAAVVVLGAAGFGASAALASALAGDEASTDSTPTSSGIQVGSIEVMPTAGARPRVAALTPVGRLPGLPKQAVTTRTSIAPTTTNSFTAPPPPTTTPPPPPPPTTTVDF